MIQYKPLWNNSNTISDYAHNSLQQQWGFSPFANGSYPDGICRGPLLRLAKLVNILFLPHLQSFICKQNFPFFCKSEVHHMHNEMLPHLKIPISKWELP